MSVVVIVDARFKMKLIEYYFPKIYHVDSSFEISGTQRIYYDLVREY